MLEFGGEELFQASPERVFAELTELETLRETIPDLVTAERIDPQTMKCVVRPGFSFLRGKLNLTITLGELDPPETAVMTIAADGIGVSMKVESRIVVTRESGGSRLAWQAVVSQMKGLVASVSPGLVRAAADQVIRGSWQRIRARLGE